jgi:hypothetical protein
MGLQANRACGFPFKLWGFDVKIYGVLLSVAMAATNLSFRCEIGFMEPVTWISPRRAAILFLRIRLFSASQ